MTQKTMYEQIEQHGGRFQGKQELLKHLSGKQITLRQALKAKCYECLGYFEDGRQDCQMPNCPLYPWMPYREGGVRQGRAMNAEQREAAAARMRAARKQLSPVQVTGDDLPF
jgi:hypothetical protein